MAQPCSAVHVTLIGACGDDEIASDLAAELSLFPTITFC